MRTAKSLFLCATLSVWTFSAHADLIWSWRIDNPVQTVSPTDTIQFTGTIFNDPSSTINIIGTRTEGGAPGAVQITSPLLFSFQGDYTPDKYTFDEGPLGPQSFNDQFLGKTISPGQSFNFVVFSLIPVSGGVTPGIYSNPVNDLWVAGSSAYLDGGGTQVTVVPEPKPLALISAGLVLVGVATRRGIA